MPLFIYLYLVAQNQIVSEMAKQDITICIDAYPDPDADVFRIGAADDSACSPTPTTRSSRFPNSSMPRM